MLSQNHTKGVIEDAEDKEKLTELILKAKQGDKEAFELVYIELYTPLYRFVLSRSRNVQTTQDICQDTFMRFYEALPRYEPDTHPLAYLFTIAKRLLINLSIKHKPVEIDEEMMATFSD
jgi:RNA polymerase sigma-70 factor (ECF subfamily)